MRRDPLESARAKIDRAKYRLSQLQRQMAADRTDQKYGIVFDHETKTDELVMRALMPYDLFIYYSIVAGEVVGHARSALEHAIWKMVPVPNPGRTGFPVFRLETKADRIKGDERYYDHDGLRMIDGINAQAAAIIKAEQPFGPDYQTNMLYLLNELWNIDKHRLLNSCAQYPEIIALSYVPRGKFIFEQRFVNVPTDVKDGAELFRAPFDPDVEVTAEIATTGVIFDGGVVDRKPVIELLLKLVEFSDRIVNALGKTI
jgi:hypothetical protein